MTATMTDIRDRMDSAATRTRRTLKRIKDYRDLTDSDLAARMGMGRTKVNNYLTGTSRLTVEMIAAFAAALDVPDFVLTMQADPALSWVLENSPNPTPSDAGEQVTPPTKWFAALDAA